MASQVGEYVPLSLLLMTLLIPLIALDQSFTVSSQETGKDLIANTCSKTEYPGDCTIALESDPRSFTSNLTQLTRIALEITASKTRDSLTVAQNLRNNQPDYPSWGFAQVCVNYYNDCVNSMSDSLKAFDELKYDKSYQSVESVNNLVNSCQNLALANFNDVNNMMLRITKVAMAILYLVF